MSLISRITRLTHPGVLRDFTWPADLPAFARFNLIYGWNGSGKTTLSRVFRALEQRVAYSPGQVMLDIGGRQFTGQDFPGATVPVRVFNRDFVNETVFPVGGGDVPPIFVVGRESVEKQKAVNRLKEQKAEKEAELQRKRSARQQAERDLDRHCADRARAIKDTLRVSGPGKYNEYNKTDYRARASQMEEAGDGLSHRVSDSERDLLLVQHRESVKPKVSLVTYRFPSLKQLHRDVADVLSATVTSSAIESLKDDAALSEWVHQGLGLHKSRSAEICLFCDQSLPGSRLSALEAHFSAEYDRFLKRLDQQRSTLKRLLEDTKGLHPPARVALYEDLYTDYDARRGELDEALKGLSTFIGELLQALDTKRGQPFKGMQLRVAVPDIDASSVARLNEVIVRHNKACDDFQI